VNFLELKIFRQFASSITYFTGLLVLGLALWICGNVFAPPQDGAAFASHNNRKPNSVANEYARLPAITFDSPKADAKPEPKVETFALNCLYDGAKINLTSAARQVRLKTDLCGHRLDLDKSNMVNRTNGFEATLFQLEKGGFSSDYIDLVEGQNQIVVQLADAKGRTISAQVAISRTR